MRNQYSSSSAFDSFEIGILDGIVDADIISFNKYKKEHGLYIDEDAAAQIPLMGIDDVPVTSTPVGSHDVTYKQDVTPSVSSNPVKNRQKKYYIWLTIGIIALAYYAFYVLTGGISVVSAPLLNTGDVLSGDILHLETIASKKLLDGDYVIPESLSFDDASFYTVSNPSYYRFTRRYNHVENALVLTFTGKEWLGTLFQTGNDIDTYQFVFTNISYEDGFSFESCYTIMPTSNKKMIRKLQSQTYNQVF